MAWPLETGKAGGTGHMGSAPVGLKGQFESAGIGLVRNLCSDKEVLSS